MPSFKDSSRDDEILRVVLKGTRGGFSTDDKSRMKWWAPVIGAHGYLIGTTLTDMLRYSGKEELKIHARDLRDICGGNPTRCIGSLERYCKYIPGGGFVGNTFHLPTRSYLPRVDSYQFNRRALSALYVSLGLDPNYTYPG